MEQGGDVEEVVGIGQRRITPLRLHSPHIAIEKQRIKHRHLRVAVIGEFRHNNQHVHRSQDCEGQSEDYFPGKSLVFLVFVDGTEEETISHIHFNEGGGRNRRKAGKLDGKSGKRRKFGEFWREFGRK